MGRDATFVSLYWLENASSLGVLLTLLFLLGLAAASSCHPVAGAGSLARGATPGNTEYEEANRKHGPITNARTRVQLALTTLGVALAWLPIRDSEVLMYSQIGHYASPATKGFHRRWIILKDRRVATIYDGYYSAEF